jgi:hypothetical protein
MSAVHKFLWLSIAVCCVATSGYSQRSISPKQERDHDDPRARAEFVQRQRGHANGGSAARDRREAYARRQAMIRQQGNNWRRTAQRSPASAAVGTEPTREMTAASGPEPSVIPANSSTWVPIGPQPANSGLGPGFYQTSAGRVTALAVDPTDLSGNTIYLGGAQGGVWKTTNGGGLWVPLTDDLEPGPGSNDSLAIGSIAVAFDGTVYVGTGEQSFSHDSYYGAGILKSANGGASWIRLTHPAFDGTNGRGVPGMPAIGGLSVQPGSNQVVLAAVDGAPPGIYRTSDGGTTWAQAAGINETATAVAFAPGGTTVAYAGVLGMGVFKSVDGGASWTPRNGTGVTGINTISSGRVELAVFDSNIVYAAVVDEVGGAGALRGLYKTINGGSTWTDLKANLDGALQDFCTNQCWYDMVVAVHPTNSNVVFVGGSGFPNLEFIQRTVDGGQNWTIETGTVEVHADQHAMAFARNGTATPDGSRLYLGNDGGAYSTTNTTSGTVAWTELNSTLNLAQFYKQFAIHPTDVNRSLGGTQDNGIQEFSGVLPWEQITCGDGAGAVYDLADPNTNIYVNCQLIDVRRSTSGTMGSFMPASSGISDGSAFIPPLIGDPAAAGRLYFGGTRLWRTNDGGATGWFPISQSLIEGVAGEFITAIAVAPSNNDVIYVATSNGFVWQGSSTGPVFTQINNGTTFGQINALAVDPANPNDVYLVQGGFSNNHVYRRAAATGTWSDTSGPLPNMPANDIVVDPDLPNTLYVATDIGVFTSSDGGSNWTPLANGLPNVAVFGLKLHRASRTLRAATHGRGMWDLFIPFVVNGSGAQLDPGSVDFGTVNVGATSTMRTIEFANVGNLNTTLGTIALTPADFGRVGGTCASGMVLAPSARCTIQITFTPAGSGNRFGTVTVNSDAVIGPVSASLSGFGNQTPANDDYANARIVNSGVYSDVETTLSATTELNDPLPSATCVNGPVDTRNHTVWYFYTPSANGTMTVDTIGSDYDTVLSVWTSNNGTLTATGCNDDIQLGQNLQSSLSMPVIAGQRYEIMVGGYTSLDAGTLRFHLAGPPPLTTSAVDFAFSGPTDTRTVIAGQSLTYNLSLAPLNGYTGSISFNCADTTMALVSCSFAPSSIDLSVGAGATVLTVTVTRANAAMRASMTPFRLALGSVWAGALLAFCCVASKPRKAVTGFMVVFVAMILASCGGGGGGATSTSPPSSTRGVSSSIVVTATGTGGNTGSTPIVHRVTLPITVVQ